MSKIKLYRDNDNNAAEPNFLEGLQAAILRRLTRTPLAQEPIVYEFTDDRALLHQYYRLREIMYRKMFETDKFVGEEDVHDKLSHILIARRGKLCIGGCRLTIREADEMFALPMENDTFKLRQIFPGMPLTQVRHGEISRYAILDADEEKLEVMHTMCRLIVEKGAQSDLGFIFVKSTLPMARNWRRIGQTSCGLQNIRICTEVKVPENPIHPEIDWYITAATLPVVQTQTTAQEIQTPETTLH